MEGCRPRHPLCHSKGAEGDAPPFHISFLRFATVALPGPNIRPSHFTMRCRAGFVEPRSLRPAFLRTDLGNSHLSRKYQYSMPDPCRRINYSYLACRRRGPSYSYRIGRAQLVQSCVRCHFEKPLPKAQNASQLGRGSNSEGTF